MYESLIYVIIDKNMISVLFSFFYPVLLQYFHIFIESWNVLANVSVPNYEAEEDLIFLFDSSYNVNLPLEHMLEKKDYDSIFHFCPRNLWDDILRSACAQKEDLLSAFAQKEDLLSNISHYYFKKANSYLSHF